MMQDLYVMLADWQGSGARTGPKSSQYEDALEDVVITLCGFFIADKDTTLGGAPAEFLPQMLLEENAVRHFPAYHPASTSRIERRHKSAYLHAFDVQVVFTWSQPLCPLWQCPTLSSPSCSHEHSSSSGAAVLQAVHTCDVASGQLAGAHACVEECLQRGAGKRNFGVCLPVPIYLAGRVTE